MARHLRIQYPGALYHITARGNDRGRIFCTREDRVHLLDLLSASMERFEVHLYAYVLMTNHYHLVVQTEHPNLDRFMHGINTAYATWMNARNRRTGHLFEGRYRAISMEAEGYLLTATGYLHLNPVRTREWRKRPIAERVAHLQEYPWSSYADHTRWSRQKRNPVVGTDRVWGALSARTPREGRRRYAAYVRGWLEQEEVERQKPKHKRDEGLINPFSEVRMGCVLGSDVFRDFVQGLLSEEQALSQDLVGHRQWRREVPLPDLLASVAEVCEAPREQFYARTRPNPARDLAMYLCREVGERSLAELAREFNVKYAAVSLATNRIREHMTNDKRFRKRVLMQREALINILKT